MTINHLPCEIKIAQHDKTLELALLGDWVLDADAPSLQPFLDQMLKGSSIQRVIFSTKNLGHWDSLLMTDLIRVIDQGHHQGIEVDTSTLPEGIQGLLKLAYTVPERLDAKRIDAKRHWLEWIGDGALAVIKEATTLCNFVGETALSLWALLLGKARFRRIDLWINIQDCGPSAVPIITLISFLIGLILAFVGALQLALFGAQIYIADMVGLGMTREMGGFMAAIIMSGRTGAAFAAQLGTMQVNSEIDALKTMGFKPMEFLVLPRILALIFIMPMLCLYADLMGIIGGSLVTVGFFDVSFLEYFNRTADAVHLKDLMVGVTKCSVFGILIALSGCMRGMQCGRSASAVGKAATSAVVTCIVFIVIADSTMTLICNRIGI